MQPINVKGKRENADHIYHKEGFSQVLKGQQLAQEAKKLRENREPTKKT